jgi:thiamine biosynthesis lipoprotein
MRSPSPDADCRGSRATLRRARPLLGTRVEIAAAGDIPAAELHEAVDAAFAAIERAERLMSYHDPASELSRINREAAARPQRLHPDVGMVVRAALGFAALSGGAFDPSVAPILEDWGFLPRHCSGGADPAASWRDVEILGADYVHFRRPLRLDLGGIAKGYAVDQAVRALRRSGIHSVLVNAGGDLRIAGERAETIALRHPRAPRLVAHDLVLHEAALATSSACYSRRRVAGVEVSALLDPGSRAAYVGGDSVSVRAADCMTADALTKVVLFADARTAERALRVCGAQALVLRADNAGCPARAGDERAPPGAFRATRGRRARRRSTAPPSSE